MAKRNYRYSLNRHDKKLVGVCSTLGTQFGIDPTFIRIAFVAAVFLISWEMALVTYAALGIYFSVQRKREVDGGRHVSEFDRMGQVPQQRASVHDVRTKLDETERRMMAIDHHLNTAKNDELAREIEALREEK